MDQTFKCIIKWKLSQIYKGEIESETKKQNYCKYIKTEYKNWGGMRRVWVSSYMK